MHNRQVFARGKVLHRLLADIEHRADLRHARAAQIRHGLEAADAPLVEQAHQKRLHRVVVVVAQRDLFVTARDDQLVERPAAHLCAHRAGVLLLTEVKDDGADLGALAHVRYLQLFTQRRDRRKIHPAQAHVDGERLEREGLGVIPAQRSERHEQRQRILAARYADGNFIACVNHMVIVDAPAHQAHHSLHICLRKK